ncbi:MAG: ROK family protein [Phycisphaera sp.]|nr:ROK family protein [Phycisphaera sp.]
MGHWGIGHSSLDPIMPYALGIDIGGTNIKAIAAKPDGSALVRHTEPTTAARDELIDNVVRVIGQLDAEIDGPVGWVGLSSPGLARPDGRSIQWMQGRLDCVQDLDWTTELEQRGLSHRVWVLNDAHAATMGEAWIGAARGAKNVVLLTLGTGVGGGLIIDGRLVTGCLGRAGHLGHISLDIDGQPDIVKTPGSLEDMIGDCTIAARTDGRFTSTRDLVDAATNGDADAQRVWERAIRALACGVVSLINVADPEVVVIGGGIAEAGDALFAPLQHEVDQREWRPTGDAARIVPATLGSFAGAIGAARHAMLESIK